MTCGTCEKFRTKKVGELLDHSKTCRSGDWAKVVEARRAGNIDTADRIARRAMGVKAPPMSDADRERLKQYQAEHGPEIAATLRANRKIRKARNERINATTETIRRKR